MKTMKLNTSKILRKTSLMICASMLFAGLFAQKSLNSFELKQYTSDLFKSSAEIISAMNSTKEKKAFYEEEILLEEWMLNLEHWVEKMDSSTNRAVDINTEVIIEEELELESWMTDYKWIQTGYFYEEELTLENWMKHPMMWNIYACN